MQSCKEGIKVEGKKIRQNFLIKKMTWTMTIISNMMSYFKSKTLNAIHIPLEGSAHHVDDDDDDLSMSVDKDGHDAPL
jgi:hypothetical protein